MPGFNECSIYEDECRKGTCVHKAKNSVPAVRLVDVVTNRGIPFRVTFGKREYRDGTHSPYEVVSFYDARYDFTEHGQFVSDYNPETLLERQRGYGLSLNGDSAEWTIDASTMNLVTSWLVHQVVAREF